MNKTAADYIRGLKQAYIDSNAKIAWEQFEAVKHGASTTDIAELKALYPAVPDSLVELLRYVDGTYWREYQGKKIAFYFLGSDVDEYPYYLLSTSGIIENRQRAVEYYADYINRDYEEVTVDDRITRDPTTVNWLHFSDCMNNGGSSQLFIDFSPSPEGTVGQVVRFLHDPDDLSVIADSFDAYLRRLMDSQYDFINEE